MIITIIIMMIMIIIIMIIIIIIINYDYYYNYYNYYLPLTHLLLPLISLFHELFAFGMQLITLLLMLFITYRFFTCSF